MYKRQGGRERYESVWKALQTLKSLESEQDQKTDYVLIHDGARPFLNQEMLERLCACVKEEKACVLGMPVKDTIKLTDENGKIRESPRRDLVWQAQTPQMCIRDRNKVILCRGRFFVYQKLVLRTSVDDSLCRHKERR